MRTPITYYGGKQRVVGWLNANMPKYYRTYVEPFAGGASLFFYIQNRANKTFVLNDKNEFVVSFYYCLSRPSLADRLIKKINITPYAESEHLKAEKIYKSGRGSVVDKAWAFFTLSKMSFAGKLTGGFGYSNSNQAMSYDNTKNRLAQARTYINKTTIHNRDALELFDMYDNPNTFFYVDPPYALTNQGHYKGWGMQNYKKLTDKLLNINGKFMISEYLTDASIEYAQKNGLKLEAKKTKTSASRQKEMDKIRTECIITNYNKNGQLCLF